MPQHNYFCKSNFLYIHPLTNKVSHLVHFLHGQHGKKLINDKSNWSVQILWFLPALLPTISIIIIIFHRYVSLSSGQWQHTLRVTTMLPHQLPQSVQSRGYLNLHPIIANKNRYFNIWLWMQKNALLIYLLLLYSKFRIARPPMARSVAHLMVRYIDVKIKK